MTGQETSASEEQLEHELNAKIAEQNDRFRTTWGADYAIPGRIVSIPEQNGAILRSKSGPVGVSRLVACAPHEANA